MKLRKIKNRLLLWRLIIYRIIIICIQTIFFWIITGRFKLALGTSIAWNIINTILYYIYHYLFARIFVIGANQKSFTLWFTGLPCSGKTTIANLIAKELKQRKLKIIQLDADYIRKTPLANDLGYSKEDRDKNIERMTYLAKILNDNDTIVIASYITPYIAQREKARQLIPDFIEIFVDCPLEECIKRDTKGMYKKAKIGQIQDFTGISAPYEPPIIPDLNLQTAKYTLEDNIKEVIDYLEKRKLI